MVDNHRAASSDSQAFHRRAEQLDALEAILPFDRRDQLAALLTDDDVVTLKHLAQQGMGENTLRALASDLGYLEAWCRLATGDPLRSGYLTEAANRGIPLPEAMQQSLHKSVTQAASYYNNAERKNGRAARLIV